MSTTNHAEVTEIVYELLERLCSEPFERSKSASLVADVGLESVELVELLHMVERRFDIEVDDAEINSIETVGELTDAIVLKLLAIPKN